MHKMSWRVSLLQLDIAIGEPEVNFARVERMLEEAVGCPSEEKPDLLVLPEMWNTGYALDRIHELADPKGERTKAFIGEFCRKHGVMVLAGSVAEKTADGVRNTIVAVGRDGTVLADYAKLHLFRLMEEEKALIAGTKPGILELDGVTAGMMICYDIRFPELARTLALSGAKVLIVPAEWPHPRLHHWRTLLQARAIENQLFVIACNRVGRSGVTDFFGHSMVIGPWGDVLVEGGEEEGILTVDINLDQVDDVRRTIPIFEDRRPDVYKM